MFEFVPKINTQNQQKHVIFTVAPSTHMWHSTRWPLRRSVVYPAAISDSCACKNYLKIFQFHVVPLLSLLSLSFIVSVSGNKLLSMRPFFEPLSAACSSVNSIKATSSRMANNLQPYMILLDIILRSTWLLWCSGNTLARSVPGETRYSDCSIHALRTFWKRKSSVGEAFCCEEMVAIFNCSLGWR
jgi:hypothetical protein